jgi:hypothetical protein
MRSKIYRSCSSWFGMSNLQLKASALYRYRKYQVFKKYSSCNFLNSLYLFESPLCLVTLEEAFGDLDKKTNSKFKLVVDKASLEDELGKFPQL